MEKFMLEVEGAGFKITLQGSGDAEAAKAATSKAFDGLVVKTVSFGTEPIDMSGK